MVHLIYNLTSNFGLTIVLCVILYNIVMMPAKYFGAKNKKAQAAAQKETKAIQKKYNANALGVSMDDEGVDLSPEIKAMSKDERANAMTEEILAVNKKYGYHMIIGFLPFIITLVFIIAMYSEINAVNTAITEVNPNNFYGLTYSTGGNKYILFGMAATTLLTTLITTLPALIKDHSKPMIISTLVGLAFGLGLEIYFAFKVTVAIAIAITVGMICSTIFGFIFKAIDKKINPTDDVDSSDKQKVDSASKV